MKSLAEIRVPRADMAVHGKGYEINTLRSIRSVRSAMSVGFWFRWRRFITRSRWVKVAHMIVIIWLRCASRVIHRYMRSVGIAGMTGRGYPNLYRPISYRTAGGSFVRSRKIEYGGYWQLNIIRYYIWTRKNSMKMKYVVTADFCWFFLGFEYNIGTSRNVLDVRASLNVGLQMEQDNFPSH